MGVGGDFYRIVGVGIVLGMGLARATAQELPAPAAHVQRQAESPLRWILEAGRLKARPKLAAPAGVARQSAARPPARRPATADRPLAEAPATSIAKAMPTVAEATSPDLPAPAVEPLALWAGDEPTLPDELDAQLQSDALLELALIVLADGSVGAVSVLSSTHPAVDEHALAAVRGWRFKPLPQAQVRSVELVFHPRH